MPSLFPLLLGVVFHFFESSLLFAGCQTTARNAAWIPPRERRLVTITSHPAILKTLTHA